MYEYHNNILSIPAKVLYEDWKVMAKNTYLSNVEREKLIRTKQGRGKGNQAWVSFYDLDQTYQDRYIDENGKPEDIMVRNELEKYILTDTEAQHYFEAHRKPDGKPLSDEKIREKTTNVEICNAIRTVLGDKVIQKRVLGKKRTKVWENISIAVNGLSKKKYTFNLPGTYRSLQRRYNAFLKDSYSLFIHKSEGSQNGLIIKDKIADFLLSQYAQPIGLTIPEVLERYEIEAKKHDWKKITSSAVYQFLYRPENERIWMLGRRDIDAYRNKFQHTLTRDKSNWFPNIYWAIDGTKLDLIHLWEASSNNLGAKLKVDVMVDVYSEKIIGWDLSFTESHVEHFRTIKMAVNEAQCRPYYLTYDNQGGHKMNRMKDLYTSIVAKEGGRHHPHKAKAHNAPIEQIFKRLQQQVINKFWFSDGQSVTVKRDDNKFNKGFVLKNKASIKTVDEIKAVWIACVNIWNNKKHPHFEMSRNEVYKQEAPMKEELDLLDIMDKMWLEEKKKPLKYYANGLRFRLKDNLRLFEVYDNDGNIDTEFRRKYVGHKFIIRYDPDHLDDFVMLCDRDADGNIIHIANAQPKRGIESVPMLMTDEKKEQLRKDYSVRIFEEERDEKALEDLRKRSGITPEKEMEDQDLLIRFGGDLTKVQRLKVESEESIGIADLL